MNPENQTVCDFAMVGHPGAGKTCLAAGLFQAVGNFVIIPDETTENYVKNACIALKGGKTWPDATGGEPRKLGYTVLHNHRTYHIRFNDFPGEMISDDGFMRQVVKKNDGSYPDGVLLLINCAAKQLDTPKEEMDMQADLRKFVAELAVNHVPIALVVTAWDRMDGKERKEEFEKHLRPITEILDQLTCKWQRFNVSVTGKLECQDNPKLAPCDVEKPFVWLIGQQKKASTPSAPNPTVKRVILILLGVLLLAVAVFAVWSEWGGGTDSGEGKGSTEQPIKARKDRPPEPVSKKSPSEQEKKNFIRDLSNILK